DLGLRLGEQVGLAGAVRVVVHDHEVDLRPGDGEDGVVPVLGVAGAGDAVRPGTGGGQHRSDLDARVGRLHRRGVLEQVGGVGRGAVAGVGVVLPVGAVLAVAVDLVADLPVLHAVVLGDVGVLDPRGGLGRGAGAVVRGDD